MPCIKSAVQHTSYTSPDLEPSPVSASHIHPAEPCQLREVHVPAWAGARGKNSLIKEAYMSVCVCLTQNLQHFNEERA